MRQIASAGKPADDISQGNGFERSGDGVVESLFGTGFVLMNERFRFREGLLDRIEVRAVVKNPSDGRLTA